MPAAGGRVAADDVDEENSLSHEISTHIPYLAHHCRQDTFGNLSRGMCTVVDQSVDARVREPDGDTERKRQ